MQKIVEEDQETIPGWKKVEKYLADKSLAGLIVALIEADKLLASRLEKQGYPGKTTDDRIKNAKEKFSNLNGLLEARQIRNDFLKNKEMNITSLDVEDGITSYQQALVDLQSGDKSHLGVFERFIISMDYYLPSKWKAIRNILIYTILFFILVEFLNKNFLGKYIVSLIVQLSDLVFSWILAIFLLILAILIVIIASLIYFERRKRKRFK
jgi:hypothetical protein